MQWVVKREISSSRHEILQYGIFQHLWQTSLALIVQALSHLPLYWTLLQKAKGGGGGGGVKGRDM